MPDAQIPPRIVRECIRVYRTELQKPCQGSKSEHQRAAFCSALEAFDAVRGVRVVIVPQSAPEDVKYLRAKFYNPIALLTTGFSTQGVADEYEVARRTVDSWIFRAKRELNIGSTAGLLAAIATDRVRRRQEA